MPAPRYRPKDFRFHDDGLNLPRGLRRQDYFASENDCPPSEHRAQCLRHPKRTSARKASRFDKKVVDAHDPSERMRQAIDTPHCRAQYSRRIVTVEPVFVNLRRSEGSSRFNLRGRENVGTQ